MMSGEKEAISSTPAARSRVRKRTRDDLNVVSDPRRSLRSDVQPDAMMQQHDEQAISTIQLLPKPMSLEHSEIQTNLPPQQLTIQDLSPFPESIWSYTVFLGLSVMVWVLHLLLPRGFRKQYCGSHRRRYAKRTDRNMPAGGYWLPANKVAPGSVISGSSLSKPTRDPYPLPQSATRGTIPSQQQEHLSPSRPGWLDDSPQQPRDLLLEESPVRDPHRPTSAPPSPEHPAIRRIPPNKVIAETMSRLQGRGIRLIAHGVQCDPKRVWIKLNDDESGDPEKQNVSWQTEFPRRVPNQSGEVSIVLMRGSLHKIPLKQVLYIDVGKKTNALMRMENRSVPDQTCLSLLTQNGSLDLQANSKLERDALVSCFSMILDQVHTEDWRALYEASPEPSMANDSTGTGNNDSAMPPYGSDMASL